MAVTILSHTQNPIDVMWVAARTCYSEKSTSTLFDECKELPEEKKLEFVLKVLKSGHMSIAEHVSFTFGLDYMSRACSHQLVRHRLCTFSQQSQRYVNFKDKDAACYCPTKILNDEVLYNQYMRFNNYVSDFYNGLIDKGVKPEDARMVLPNSFCTNLVMTTNLRNLIHIAELRLCTRAQAEIRSFFRNIRDELVVEMPWLDELLVPQCERLGYCPEHKCCGRKEPKHG